MRIFIPILFLLFSACGKSQQQAQVNGDGPQTTINNGASSLPINGAFYYPPQTGDIDFTDRHFQFSIPGYAKTNFIARSTAGFVNIRTKETSMDIKVAGNWVAHGTQSQCEVLVNNVWNQSVTVTIANTIQTIPITLPAGEKIVTLLNGYTANALAGSIVLPDAGVYIQGIITTGPVEIQAPYPTLNKWVFLVNSIGTGASGTHPAATGFPALFRLDGRYVEVDGWGGRSVATTSEALGNTMAAFVSAEMNGVKTNELFICLGTNNYGLSNQTKATFKTYYQNMLDAIIAIRPDIIIYCVSLINRTNYDSGNLSGATGDDFADAIEELTTTRPTTRFIYGKNLVSLANCPDGIHPNQTGMQQYHDNLLIEYNLLAKAKVIPLFEYAKTIKLFPYKIAN